MILFENSIIKLDYDPATDIAVAAYPDLYGYLLPEIKHSIDNMVDVIRNYDVKNLMLDATRTVSEIDEAESREIATYLAAGIMRTRVQKVARLQSKVNTVETRVQNNIKHLKETQQLPFQLQNFTDKDKALEWLQHNDAS